MPAPFKTFPMSLYPHSIWSLQWNSKTSQFHRSLPWWRPGKHVIERWDEMGLCCLSIEPELQNCQGHSDITLEPMVIAIRSVWDLNDFTMSAWRRSCKNVLSSATQGCCRKNGAFLKENHRQHFRKNVRLEWKIIAIALLTLEQKHKVELGNDTLKHLPNKSSHTEVRTDSAGNKSSFTWWSLRCDKLASTRGN